ncbi:probable 40S ribosomal protein S15 [Ustilago bromivora]|uniref:Probable 40S ribosomal protein S15 n=1 Tax=Ustilago bromivora TaxID=307758 RepID=A0A8H8QG89_9BASI|nr:probable 40S ribosomal protein S15 [Ustilago bromivora]
MLATIISDICFRIARADNLATLLPPIHLPQLCRDEYDAAAAAELKRKRTFRKFTYRGVELDSLLDMSNEDFMSLVHARARRKFQRGLKRKPMGLIKRLRKAKAECEPNEKPATVKTHLRDMIIVPEMIGSMIGIYTGRFFVNTEIKPEMVGHYLGEFAMTYIPTRHGAKGKGATVDRFLPIR